MKPIFAECVCAMTVLAVLSSVCQAQEVQLSRHYSDNMVLRRDQPVVIRGVAKPGAQVVVSCADQTSPESD
jgi:hypothetical protein